MRKVLEDKRNVVILLMSVIFLVAIIAGMAYAYIAYYTRQKGINVLAADCIKVEMEDLSEAISLVNAHPIRDEEGLQLKPYRFRLTNTCGVGVNYNVNLEVLDIENRMASKNVAIKIDNESIKTLTNEIETHPIETEEYNAVESYILYHNKLNVGESKEHELRIWLHSSAGNDSQNKSFQSKVVIEAIQNQYAGVKLNNYIVEKSASDSTIEKIDHEATEQTPVLTDYRYTGANPNNYVYFGCEDNCTEDNLYRIIGVIPTQNHMNDTYENRVKLIKANYYTENESGLLLDDNRYPAGGGSGKGYQWNSSANNKWEESTLQSQVLNGVYWNSLGEYQKYIEQAKWYLGAPTGSNYQTYTTNQFYTIERSNTQGYSKGATNYVGNIGLMYPSDYGYSIGSNNKDNCIYENGVKYKENAWLYNLESEYYEWTIIPENNNSDIGVWYLDKNGLLLSNGLVYYSNYIWGIRPTFYLKEEVLYEDGDGSIGNPYRIKMEIKQNLSDYLIVKSETDTSLEKIDHEATIQTPTLTDYRYIGANPNNYVYFGCEGSTCTEDHLYRIIGVIPTKSSSNSEYENRVKLIKANYYTENESGLLTTTTGQNPPGGGSGKGYYWNSSANNKWEESTLQKQVLNGVYWNSLGEYQNYITTTLWYLGAGDNTKYTTYTPDQFYTIERSNTQGYSKGATNYVGNIGLMYPSDFGYSIGSNYKGQSAYENSENYKNSGWMYNLENKYYEWTISPESTSSGVYVWAVQAGGSPRYNSAYYPSNVYGIRPTFYLKENVLYESGNGSINSPYRIHLKEKTLSDYIIYKSTKNETIAKIDHEETVQTPALTDYRYTGSSPNNYVYFGCTTNCTDNHLYRIIGVIPTQSKINGPYENRVKLIKAKYYTESSSGLLGTPVSDHPAPGGKGYLWNTSKNDNWSTSSLQKMLNGVYLDSLKEYHQFIGPAVWHLGASTKNIIADYTPDVFYKDERGDRKGYSGGSTSFVNYIGLMYPSDYGYSLGIEYKGQSIYNNETSYKSSAWLYNLENKYYEWTIAIDGVANGITGWHLVPRGYVTHYGWNNVYYWGIRPTFYLRADVNYSGDGTYSNPYRLHI